MTTAAEWPISIWGTEQEVGLVILAAIGVLWLVLRILAGGRRR